MPPKSDHDEDMSMEEILASIRKFVTDSQPAESNKQPVYKGDLTESVVIPPAGHAMSRSQEESYSQTSANHQSYNPPPLHEPHRQEYAPPSSNRQPYSSAPQYEPDVLELISPISPAKPHISSLAEWGVPTSSIRAPFKGNGEEEAPMTLTNPIETKKAEKPNRFSMKPSQFGEQETSLGSAHALASSANSLSRLAQASKTALHKKTSGLANQRDVTLDQLIQEMIRPMIKQWIDTHLPSMVEEMVAKEIQRITKHLS